MTKPNKYGRRNRIAADRISTLPDDVLRHMLSFLSTKEAVRTCILAKRWRKTWASVPVLKFDLEEFLTNINDLDDDEIRKEAEDKFEKLVNGVLANREPSHLDMFQYEWCIDEYSSEKSLEWLDQVALLMPRVVSVFIYRENAFDMPDLLIFSSAHLQELDLSLYANDKTPIRPKEIDLPSLKYLELRSVDLDDDFARKLFSGCRALKNLYLGYCDLGFSSISSKVLKTLVLQECNQLEPMQICCPCLAYLKITCFNQTKGISLKNTTSISYADITLNTDVFEGDLNLLTSLSNVSTLKLDVRFAGLREKMEKSIRYCKDFVNLKSLDIGKWKFSKDTNLFAFFLRHSPNLQELTLNLDEDESLAEDGPEEPNQGGSGAVNFQREYLKTVRIIKWKYYTTVKLEKNDPLIHQVIRNLQSSIRKAGQIIY